MLSTINCIWHICFGDISLDFFFTISVQTDIWQKTDTDINVITNII